MGKKEYTKPVVMFEPLAMAAEASASCALSITFQEFVCPVMIPEWGETVYQEYNCDWSNDNGTICYHVPTISTNVFGS